MNRRVLERAKFGWPILGTTPNMSLAFLCPNIFRI